MYKILSFIFILPGLMISLYLFLWFNNLNSLALSAMFGGPGFVIGYCIGIYKLIFSTEESQNFSSALKNAFFVYAYAVIGLLVALILFYGYLTFTKYLRK